MKKRYKYPLFGILLVLIGGIVFGIWWLDAVMNWAFFGESVNQAIIRLEKPVNDRFENAQKLARELPKRDQVPKHLVDNLDSLTFDPPLIETRNGRNVLNFTLDRESRLLNMNRDMGDPLTFSDSMNRPSSITALNRGLQEFKQAPWYARGRLGERVSKGWESTLAYPYAIIMRTNKYAQPSLDVEKQIYATGEYDVDLFIYDLRDNSLKSCIPIVSESTIKPLTITKQGEATVLMHPAFELERKFEREFLKRFKITPLKKEEE